MSDENPTDSKTEEKLEFKKPVLVGRVGKLPKKAKNEAEVVIEQKIAEKPRENAPESSVKSNLPPAVLLKEISTPIPYKEPKWSGLCPDGSDYALEVLKSGMIVEKVDLTQKPYYVFGRLANCDVVMAHPTISRHHCILQYKAFAAPEEPASGWYLYDLSSTHGTYLNRDKLKPLHYVRVRVGHQIKFGNSTRTYIMLGPDFDCEGESELTVTEIKQKAEQMRLERDRAIQEAKEQREKEILEEQKRIEEQGIDWGMSEDAEDEPDLFDNPYASTANEELYLKDPKKTLRGYFEREGLELQYDCQDRGHSQYICRVELPLDDARGRPVVAEAIHTGKKKDTVVACALEACRILDRAGLLRQATHEPRRRKRVQDEDYDSDSDTFLDRTGAVEAKREARKHNNERQATLTYQQLLEKVQEIESQIANEESGLERLRNTNKQTDRQTDEQTDSLDEYMCSLKAGGQSMSVKAEISKAKMSIQKLKAELSKTQRLADLARPADLPPLVKKDNKMAVKINNSVVYGKRIKLKNDIIKKPTPQITKKEDSEFVEEMDSDEEKETNIAEVTSERETAITSGGKEIEQSASGKGSELDSAIEKEMALSESTRGTETGLPKTNECLSSGSVKSSSGIKQRQQSSGKEMSIEESSSGKGTDVASSSKRDKDGNIKVYGPMRPPENYVLPEDYFNQESDRDLPEIMEKDD